MRSPFISGASLRTEIVLLTSRCSSTRHALARLGANATRLGTFPNRRAVLHAEAGRLTISADPGARLAYIGMPCRASRKKRGSGVADRRAVEQCLEMLRLGECAALLDRVGQREQARVSAGIARVAACAHRGRHVVPHGCVLATHWDSYRVRSMSTLRSAFSAARRSLWSDLISSSRPWPSPLDSWPWGDTRRPS